MITSFVLTVIASAISFIRFHEANKFVNGMGREIDLATSNALERQRQAQATKRSEHAGKTAHKNVQVVPDTHEEVQDTFEIGQEGTQVGSYQGATAA